MLEVKGMNKSYGENSILQDVDLAVADGEFVAIMGQSGCGKSTLLYCASGMDRPDSGQVQLDSRELSGLSDQEMERLRLTKMGFIFQKPNFLKNLSIRDNIMFPAMTLKKRTKKEIAQRAEALMEKMDILKIAEHDIRTVSGGQMQRAAICRALINSPKLVFGDEPTGALNSSATQEVMDILNQINQEGTAILLVTHDARVAARADRVIYLEDGCVKDELVQGKYVEAELSIREKRLRYWLEQMGF